MSCRREIRVKSLTFEYFKPWRHYPEALVYQASDAMDRILGRG
jgi:L-ribulose-5-phosphate 3-epimerase